MATIDLRDEDLRAAFNLDKDGTVLKPYQRGRVEGRRPVGDSRQMIVELVRSAAQPLTRLDIAKALKRSKSPHLVNLINELADSSEIVLHVSKLKNGMLEYRYWGR